MLEEAFAEYRALRASVRRHWNAAGTASPRSDVADVIRFNEALDRAIAESVREYSPETDKQAGQGTGLGLYIARRMAEAHGGSVDVESSGEEGTTFTVRLPRRHPYKIAE